MYSNGLIEMISITLMKLPLLVVFLINEKVGGAASNRTPNLGARYRTVNQYKNLCCNMWWVMLRATSKYNQRENSITNLSSVEISRHNMCLMLHATFKKILVLNIGKDHTATYKNNLCNISAENILTATTHVNK